MTSAYIDRQWLNADDNPSTGSVVAYDGPAPWDDRIAQRAKEVSAQIAAINSKISRYLATRPAAD